MHKDINNSEIEAKKWQIVDSWIIGCIREGRYPGKEDFEDLQLKTGISIDELKARAETLQAEHADETGLSKKSDLEKIIHFIKSAKWRRNEVLGIIENQSCEHVSEDDIFINIKLGGATISQAVLRALLRSKQVTSYHPAKEYFTKLAVKKFNPDVNYFAELAKYVETDDRTFFAEMLRKHFIRAIDQLFRNISNRYVLVFFGEVQDKGKTHLIKWLNPLPDRYYSERPMRADKDSEIQLATAWIYNIDELEGLSRAEISKTKSYISRSIINERAPYAAEAKILPRLASIFASTNDREFLTDIQNTRWLIFEIKDICHDYNNFRTGVKGIDVNCLWLQAYTAWQEDNSAGILTSEEKVRQTTSNKNYNVNTIEYQLIVKHFRQPGPDDKPRERNANGGFDGDIESLSATDILIRLSEKYPHLKINSVWVGRELRRAGFTSILHRINGQVMRGYELVWSDEGFQQIKNTIDELPF